VQIQRKVVGQGGAAEDVGDQLAVARAEAHRVVAQLVVVVVEAEIQHEQRIRKAFLAQRIRPFDAARMAAQQFRVRVHDVGVRRD